MPVRGRWQAGARRECRVAGPFPSAGNPIDSHNFDLGPGRIDHEQAAESEDDLRRIAGAAGGAAAGCRPGCQEGPRQDERRIAPGGQPAQLKRELNEAREQQAATAEVLRVISIRPLIRSRCSTPVRAGLTLFPGAAISIALVDAGMVKAVAVAEPDRARAEAWRRRFPFPLTRDYMHSVAILDRQLLDFPDARKVPEELAAGGRNFLASGYRAMTIMPMMHGDEAIGALSVVRLAPGPLSDRQLELLKTFAAQAVIAIENTRLLNELRQRTDDLAEALEQQTATSEVLQVISSSPGELEPVFDAMLENATRICEANFGNLLLVDGEGFRLVAPQMRRRSICRDVSNGPLRPRPVHRCRPCMRNKTLVHIADVTEKSPTPKRSAANRNRELAGPHVPAVPMLKDEPVVGVILIYRQEVRPFTDKQIELVQNFAAQAVIAIENTRLLNELRQRTDDLTKSLEQQTATSEVLQCHLQFAGRLAAGVSSHAGERDPHLRGEIRAFCSTATATESFRSRGVNVPPRFEDVPPAERAPQAAAGLRSRYSLEFEKSGSHRRTCWQTQSSERADRSLAARGRSSPFRCSRTIS